MGYVACNEKLGKVLADCANEKAGSLVRVPWSATKGLTATGRVALIASASNGLLGVSSNGAGGHKFYYGEARTGNWFFEVWSVWKAAAYATVLLMIAVHFMSQGGVGFSSAGLLLSGAAMVVVFGGRALGLVRHWAVAGSIIEGKYSAGVVPSVLGFAFGVGCAASGGMSLLGMQPTKLMNAQPMADISLAAMAQVAVMQFVILYAVIVVLSKFFWRLGLELPSMRATVDVASKSRFYTRAVYEASVGGDAGGNLQADYGLAARPGNWVIFMLFFVLVGLLALWPFVG